MRNEKKRNLNRIQFSIKIGFNTFYSRLKALRRSALLNLLVLCFFLQPNLAIIASAKNSGNARNPSETSTVKLPDKTAKLQDETTDNVDNKADSSNENNADNGFAFADLLSVFKSGGNNFEAVSTMPLSPPTPEPVAIVRKGFNLNGKIDGTIQQLNGEATIFNSTGNVTGDLKVPGVPSVVINGSPIFGGVITGSGTATPSNYSVTLNSGSRLRNLLNRTNPITMPTVATPTASTGTVNLVISNPSQVPASFANVRDITLNTGAGTVAVPPGNYRNIIVNSGTKIRLGTVGSPQPIVYNFAQLTFNSTSGLEVAGPVIINSSASVTINGSTGISTNEGSLRIRISTGNFTLNSSSNFYGTVTAPNGTVTINSNSNFYGNVACNQLIINSSGLLKVLPLDVVPSVSLSITSPANNFSTTASSIAVSGTASNQYGIANVFVNNQPAVYNATNGTWSISNVALSVGSNTITVKAVDNVGAETTSTITVTRTQPPPPDTTAPTLTITNPANNSTTQATSVTVSGTVADLGTNASGVASVTVNGSNAAISIGNWNFAGVGLNTGSNTITVRATDIAGNFTTQTVSITRQPANVPDTTPPILTIISPANNSTTQSETTTVSGTVTDTGGTTPSGVANVKVNGVNAVLTGGNWSLANFALTVGANTITVTSADNAGNVATQTRTVTRENVPDTTAPTIIITNPTTNFATQAETVNVSGTVTDTGGTVPSGVANVKVNGVTATITGGNWTLNNVVLTLGTNTITVTSTDVAGNTSTAPVTVTRNPVPDTTAPTLTITSPQNQFSTFEGQVTVTGTAVDQGISASGVQHVFVNGTEANLQPTGIWTISVSLNPGDNAIVATAVDGATPPNQGTAQIQITRLENPAPTLTIVAPLHNSTTTAATVSVSGTATANGSISNQVAQITVNGQNATFDANTHIWTLNNLILATGVNTITVVATDSSGKQTTSQITIIRRINQPPTVNAGPDRTIHLPNYADLDGTVTDDGLPNNPPTTIWSKVSGTGTVSFGNVNNRQTTASFSTVGIYTLRLTSFDGEFSANDDLIIIVNPDVQAPIPNNYRQFSDSPWYRFSGSWFYLEDFEDHILNAPGVSAPFGGLVSILYGPTFHDSVDGDDGVLDGSGSTGDTFYNSNAFQGIKFVFNQQVLGNYPTHAGLVYTDGYNEGQTFYEAFDSADNSLGIRGPFSFPSTTHKGEAINDFFLGFYNQSGISSIRIWNTQADIEIDHLQYGYSPGTTGNVQPAVYAGADQTINVSSFANLSGIVVDDGLPLPANLTINWSKISGQGTVTFSNPDLTVTTATFSQSGTYNLRLTATDGLLTSYDEITVEVTSSPSNQAPTVNAGPDQTITRNQSANLSGVVGDDGLPNLSTVSSLWSKVSGSGNAVFSNINLPNSTVSFDAAGVYVLRLTATDGQLSATDEITITVDPQNQAPIVNAGNDISITQPALLNLIGYTADDGLPAGSSLAVVWSKASGAGNVTFSNPTSANTNITFSQSGVYVLRLTATDSQLTSSDDITVTVNAAATNQPPTVEAGANQTISLPNAAILSGTATDDGLPSGSTLQITWTKTSGAGNVTFANANSANTTATFSATGSYVLRLTATDGQATTFDEVAINVTPPNTAPIVNAGQDKTVALPNASILSGTATDDGYPNGTLTTTWSKVSGGGNVIFSNPTGLNTSASFGAAGTYNLRLTATDGELTTTDDVIVTVNPQNQPAMVEAGNNQTISLPNSATLSGTATDDGLPSGSTLQISWTKTSGTGTVTFANANSAATTATFSQAGSYVLRLTATDGEFTVFDEVAIIVNPQNTAPSVNLGLDKTASLNRQIALNSQITDDGLPNNTLTYAWTKISGGGNVVFSQATSASTYAAFDAIGVYVVRLTVSDGELSASDDVAITVTASNQAPIVDAGANQNVQLPANSATLSGTATDDGLPSGNTLSINWTKTSGSGNVVFANANSATTNAAFSAAGVYVLRLTASDGQFTVFDEVAVNVSPTGGTNQPPIVNVGADQSITLSQTAVLEAQVSDDGLPAGGSFSANWTKVSGAGTVNFSNPTQTATYATFSQTGVYVLRLMVSDSALSAFDEVTVTVANNQAGPTADILTPLDGANLTDKTDITANVSGGNWKVEYALQTDDNPNNLSWTLLNQGSGTVSNLVIGTFDTTLLLNGLYVVRLTATDQFGQSSVDEVSLAVERNLKVGQFTVSFDDLSVPVAGIPIQVIRTYDSRDKRKGDFGYGWTLGIKNLRVEKSQVLGLKWRETASGGIFPTYCIEDTRPHIVSVTMPDGKVEKFDARLQQMCRQYVPIQGGNLIFAPQSGTTGKLEVVGDNAVQVAGSIPGPVDFIGFNGQGIFDSAQFKYTAKDGTEFILNQNGGLQSVKDLNNNTLTITPNGITHSSGKSVTFNRDSQGRIASITDPEGHSNTYTYDANGDLVTFTNRENQQNQFTYYTNPAHHLKDITDAQGITPIRNEYGTDGRLIKHIDANGNEINYIHNLAARVEKVNDRLGNQTTFSYDERGNVLQKTDALNNTTSFTYDGNDNVLTETNALGKTTTFTYDNKENRLSVTDALGNRNEFTYNNLSQILTIKDAKNNVTTNVYGFQNNLVSTTDALGNVTSQSYNVNTGNRVSTVDALGNTTIFAYAGNYLTKQTDAQGNETKFSYDQNGNPKTQTVKRTNAQGQLETITTISEYDNLNRLTKTTQADGTFTQTAYNTIGQQESTTDQAGNSTQFVYDTLGRQIKTTYADGKFEESTFDAEGRRLTSKDRSGKVTNYEYDVLGRLKKTTYSDGTFTTTNYDAIGRVISNTDAKGNTTTQEYDPNCGCPKRKSKIINALGQITTFVYDNNGNQTSMTDARGNTISYEFDALNRQTKIIYPDNTFSQVIFDALGRKISSKDQAGKNTNYNFDSLGNLTKVTDALNQETKFTYNELSQQISQIDAKNNTTRYEYDKLGRRTKRILPVGQVESYNYNNLSNLTSKTDFNGKMTTFNYDSMRRLLNKIPDASLNEPNISFTYNDLGQRQTMSDATGTTNYVYNSRNRLASKQTPQGNLNYTYDNNGSIKTLRSNNLNGVSADYTYDNLNRLQAVKDNRLTNGLDTTSYAYDGVGNLSFVAMPNGVATSYNYNSLNRLTNVNSAKNGNTIASYVYTLGATGNRTQLVENNSRTVNYAYDDLYRLTSETIANGSNNGQINYQYDAVGNRLQRSSSVNLVANQNSSFDANDRLNSDIFDANGNTKISNGNSYGYDFENRLTSTGNIQIIYDGDGNRVSKIVNGIRTNYLVDTNNLTGYAQVVEELKNNQVTKQYTYGLDLVSQRQASGVSFYNYDGHGSVRGLSDNLGNVTDTYSYDAFGNLVERVGTTANNYLYVGEQFDPDLGFYYNRARYLNVGTSRFISQDSYEGVSTDPKSLHKYLYVGNNPVDLIDPSGNSYVETLQVPVISNIIDSAFIAQSIFAIGAGYLIARIFTKRWTLYASIKPQFPEYHNAIFAIDLMSGKKWAYDVGAERAVWVRDITSNPFNFYPAFILKHQREPESEYLFPIPIGKMNDSQLVAWEFAVMGSSNGADFPNEVPFFYSLAFSNCATWTLSASETAILLSLNPI